MKVKILLQYALPLVCSVFFLFCSQEVKGQFALSESSTVIEYDNSVIKHDFTKTIDREGMVTFNNVPIGSQSTKIVNFGFGDNKKYKFKLSSFFNDGAESDFELKCSGVCSSVGVDSISITFKPTSLGRKMLTIGIEAEGTTVHQTIYIRIIANAIVPISLILDESSPEPEPITYIDANLTLEFKNLSKYHFISVPFKPTSIEVKGSDGVLVDDSKYQILYYDSRTRATRGLDSRYNNWVEIWDTGLIEKGKGYIIGFDNSIPSPVKVSFISNKPLAVFTSSSISLAALRSRFPRNANWYLIGSKLFNDYSMLGEINLKYAQVFNGIDYDLKLLSSNASFRKYSSCFVQYAGGITNTCVRNSILAPMQKRFTSLDQNQYILSLSNGTKEKRVVIVSASDGDESYQVGGDLLSMGPMGKVEMALFINHPSGKLVADYISKENHIIELDTKTIENKNYTFSIKGDYSAEGLYLYDSVTGDRINLLETDYSFIGASNISNRFKIEIKASQLPSSSESKIENDLYFISEKGKLRIENLNKEYDFELLDISGKKVVEYFHQSTDFEITDLKSGLYFIVCNNSEGSFFEKVIIK